MNKQLSLPLFAALLAVIAAPAWAQEQPEDSETVAMEIVGKMQSAVGKLKKLDTGKPTQTTQKQIVDRLDGLITKLQEQADREGGRRGLQARKRAADSTIGEGPGGMGQLHAAHHEGKDWGELPPHERDRILQSMTEGFPPHYQRILERYYKRVAQEAPVGSAPEAAEAGAAERPAADAPKTAPAAPAASEAPAAGNER